MPAAPAAVASVAVVVVMVAPAPVQEVAAAARRSSSGSCGSSGVACTEKGCHQDSVHWAEGRLSQKMTISQARAYRLELIIRIPAFEILKQGLRITVQEGASPFLLHHMQEY